MKRGPTLTKKIDTTDGFGKASAAASSKRTINLGIEEKKPLTLAIYLKENFNPIQQSIISFFDPIAISNPQQIVFGFLENWKVSSNFEAHGLNKNESCEKLIQMLLSMQIPPDQVLAAINEWITGKGYLANKVSKELNLDSNNKQQATLQSLVCHLVYTYLAYNISNNFQYLNQQ